MTHFHRNRLDEMQQTLPAGIGARASVRIRQKSTTKVAPVRGDESTPATVMAAKCAQSGTRRPSHAASCRRRADLTLRRGNPAIPPFEQRLIRARRANCAKRNSGSFASADVQGLPQISTLVRLSMH